MSSLLNLLQQAVQHHQQGQLDEAATLYQQLLQQNPAQPDALHLLGVIAYQRQHYSVALDLIQKAIQITPEVASYYNNLGNVLQALQQTEPATRCYQRALQLDPKYSEPYHNLANLAVANQQMDEAKKYYRQALRLNPQYFEAHYQLGNLLYQQNDLDAAETHLQAALALNSRHANLHNILGSLFGKQEKAKEAITHFQKAIELDPQLTDAYSNLGLILSEIGESSSALFYLQKALALDPHFVDAYFNMAKVLFKQNQFTASAACYQRVLELKPNFAGVYADLANISWAIGHITQALTQLRQALAIEPSFPRAHSNLLFTLHYVDANDLKTPFLEHQLFNQQHSLPLRSTIRPFPRPKPKKKLKVAYLSADLYRHSVSYFMSSILAHHDRQQIESYGYSLSKHEDETTEKLQSLLDHWVNCTRLSDEEIAEHIRAQKIDILVDLMGHSGNNRILIFSRKPAPIQVTYLGYPGTTGLEVFDYRITDSYADPEEISAQFSTEIPIRMPHSYFCYEPAQSSYDLSIPNLPALENGYITFGSFNNYPKLTEQILVLWIQILKSVPNSKLLIKARAMEDLPIRETVKNYFMSHGIAEDRLLFSAFLSELENHLGFYCQADIALDTYPYNGATTTCECLWMGLPVVTLVGKTHASRMGLSILSALKLKRLITDSPEDYVKTHIELANDFEYLQEFRTKIRERMQNSPLMDGKGFTQQLEKQYWQMWQNWMGQFSTSKKGK